MSNHTQRDPVSTNPTYGVVLASSTKVKSGLGFDSSGNCSIFDTAGSSQISSATTGVTIPNLIATNEYINGLQGTAGSDLTIAKTKTGCTDATAIDFLTITVPNLAASALIRISGMAVLGAGGAIGANEAVRGSEELFVFTRTAGVAAVAAVATATSAVATNVAGATSIASVALTVSTVSGAVGATNTFTIKVNITKTGGASDNHRYIYRAELTNIDAGGITMAIA